jgi:hypothetical protein
LVSDGFSSYVIFLYADGLIQWTSTSVIHAEVGINAGNGVDFARHPDSRTEAIINIATAASQREGLREECLSTEWMVEKPFRLAA